MFPNHKGLIVGIVVSGLGLSQTIFVALQKIILKTDGDSFIESLPRSFVIIGSIYAGLQLIGSLLMKSHVDSSKLDSTENESDNCLDFFGTDTRTMNSQVELKPHQLLLEFDFWILWLTFVLNSSSNPIFTSLRNGFGESINITDDKIFGYLTVINMIGGFFNFAGRIFWGYLIDRKPYKVIMLILTLGNSVFMGTILTLYSVHNETLRLYLFMFWVAVLNFLQGGNFSVFPMICAQLFGINNFVLNYGVLFTANSLSASIISVVATLAESRGYERLYFESFLTASIMSVIAAGLTILYRGKSLIMNRY